MLNFIQYISGVGESAETVLYFILNMVFIVFVCSDFLSVS